MWVAVSATLWNWPRIFGVLGTGSDIDRSRLTVCHEKGLRAVLPDSIDGEFDIIISSNVIEHVFDLQDYMRMISRHLANGGDFVFSGLEKSVIPIELKKSRFKLLHPIEHRNVLTRKSLSKLLGSHGMRLVTRREVLGTMRRVRSKAPLYLPYWLMRGFVAVNGVFTAIAKHE